MKTTERVNDYPKLDIAMIRRIRKESGRSVAQCAREAGMPPEMWELFEAGLVRKTDVGAVIFLWQGLRCDPKAIMTEIRGKFTKVPEYVYVIDSDISDKILPIPSARPGKRPKKRRRPTSLGPSTGGWNDIQPSLN
ncbi:hypothetical protein [Novipirellula artificiosorum]|uniref:Uncharacterized protein n=1 Tax=Novipirellula artificiosorum TaxID=2528016 RepID=A0A5C6DV92_9BACT|nr:hypothetical protein [Novipirellula artificiosorum]TWU39361.1 hypothetical protein Poly41_21850 [Novipirellula artificiosorum]